MKDLKRGETAVKTKRPKGVDHMKVNTDGIEIVTKYVRLSKRVALQW
jgi:hypothetical protein